MPLANRFSEDFSRGKAGKIVQERWLVWWRRFLSRGLGRRSCGREPDTDGWTNEMAVFGASPWLRYNKSMEGDDVQATDDSQSLCLCKSSLNTSVSSWRVDMWMRM